MSFLSLSPKIILDQAAAEIKKTNYFTAQFGLTLSYQEALDLAETSFLALRSNGRAEFGGGVIKKIIRIFCTSPYLGRHNYVETLHDLTEIFYYYKNETLDLISDDELLAFMKKSFDGTCQGSLELLAGRELANLARDLRFGYDPASAADFLNDGDGDCDVQY